MIIPSGFKGYDVLGDLADQELASENRRLEPASPVDFLKWVGETLREHNEKHSKLLAEHQNLIKQYNIASIGLDRLGSLIGYTPGKDGGAANLEDLRERHRNLEFAHRGIGYILDRCKTILTETATNYQFVGETLRSPLADRQKKTAMQKELGLRLRDVDNQFSKCSASITEQKARMGELSSLIQKLMSAAGVKMPPHIKEKMLKEVQVAQIAQEYGKSLKKKSANPSKLNGFGEGTQDTSESTSVVKNIFEKFAIAALLSGLTIGALVFFCRGGNEQVE